MTPFVLLLAALTTGPLPTDREHEPFIKLLREWSPPESELVDPTPRVLVADLQRAALWIESDGRPRDGAFRKLPSGLSWTAFVVAPEGLALLRSPIRLTSPSADNARSFQDVIYLVGTAEGRHWMLSLSDRHSGDAFHVGSGSGMTSMTVDVPESATPVLRTQEDSVLPPEQLQRLAWSEELQPPQWSVKLRRTSNE